MPDAVCEYSDASAILLPSQQELMVALDSGSMATWTWHIDSGRMECSHNMAALYGRTLEQFEGTLAFVKACTHPEDREKSILALGRAAETKQPFDWERRILCPDGSVRWLHSRARVFCDETGRAVRLVGTSTDVTARKEAEQALRFQKAVLEAQNEASLEGVLVVSPEARILSYNRRFAQMWGIPEDVLATGSDDAALAAVKDKIQNLEEFLARVAYLYEHPEQSGHYDAILKDGRAFKCYGVPLRSPDGTPLGRMFHFRDISEDRRAEQVMLERNALRTAVKALDRVLGVVGHELRTPLAAVRLLSEVLLESHDDAGQRQELLDSVHQEVVRMSAMVNDLLEVARLNSGTARWNWSTLPVLSACDQAMDSVRPLIDQRQVALELTVEPLDLMMRGDADAIRRLVLNLVNNACKHTTCGSIRVSARSVSIASVRYVQLEVKDTGSGMSAATAERLGQAFALNSGVIGESHVRGSGLGLAICRGIVAAHGGRITVASEPGRGTTVTALLQADLPDSVKCAHESGIIKTVNP